MIYKDKYAQRDDEKVPGERPNEFCLNCGDRWGLHNGWACAPSGGKHRFSECLDNERYLTQSMKDSIAMPKKEPFKTWEQALGKRVRCISVHNPSHYGKTGTCVEVNNDCGLIKWDTLGSNWWSSHDYFEPVDDNDIPIGNTAPSPVIHHATVDLSDWKVWAKRPSHECPCGIVRAQCTYHKG